MAGSVGAVEEDQRDAEREQKLHADRVERNVDRVGDVGAEERSRSEQHDHARDPQHAGDDL